MLSLQEVPIESDLTCIFHQQKENFIYVFSSACPTHMKHARSYSCTLQDFRQSDSHSEKSSCHFLGRESILPRNDLCHPGTFFPVQFSISLVAFAKHKKQKEAVPLLESILWRWPWWSSRSISCSFFFFFSHVICLHAALK